MTQSQQELIEKLGYDASPEYIKGRLDATGIGAGLGAASGVGLGMAMKKNIALPAAILAILGGVGGSLGYKYKKRIEKLKGKK